MQARQTKTGHREMSIEDLNNSKHNNMQYSVECQCLIQLCCAFSELFKLFAILHNNFKKYYCVFKFRNQY